MKKKPERAIKKTTKQVEKRVPQHFSNFGNHSSYSYFKVEGVFYAFIGEEMRQEIRDKSTISKRKEKHK